MIDAGTGMVVIGAIFVIGSSIGLTWRYLWLRHDDEAFRRELEQRYR